jgi:hypothetical protein
MRITMSGVALAKPDKLSMRVFLHPELVEG